MTVKEFISQYRCVSVVRNSGKAFTAPSMGSMTMTPDLLNPDMAALKDIKIRKHKKENTEGETRWYILPNNERWAVRGYNQDLLTS